MSVSKYTLHTHRKGSKHYPSEKSNLTLFVGSKKFRFYFVRYAL